MHLPIRSRADERNRLSTAADSEEEGLDKRRVFIEEKVHCCFVTRFFWKYDAL
jgi:hypothetical protein